MTHYIDHLTGRALCGALDPEPERDENEPECPVCLDRIQAEPEEPDSGPICDR